MRNDESFSVLWGSPTEHATENHRPFKSNEEAKAARDKRYQELKRNGVKARRSVLRGQLRQYWGFGIPCGEVCDCYHIYIIPNVNPNECEF